MTEPTVIGIAGCSQSGKSTLSRLLASHYNCENFVIPLDSFFNFNDLPTTKNSKGEIIDNIECPEAIDWKLFMEHERMGFDAMKKRAKEEKKAYIIIEGFLLFYHPEIEKIFDLKIWTECSKEDGCKRRVRGKMFLDELVNYYNLNVWGSYLKYKDTQLKNIGENVLKLNSSELKPEEMLKLTFQYIENQKPNKNNEKDK